MAKVAITGDFWDLNDIPTISNLLYSDMNKGLINTNDFSVPIVNLEDFDKNKCKFSLGLDSNI